MSASMESKTVVVTGSTGGIGFYSAQEIARLGARVIIAGIWRTTWNGGHWQLTMTTALCLTALKSAVPASGDTFAHLIDDEYKHLNTLREHGGFHKTLLEGRTLQHFHVYIKECRRSLPDTSTVPRCSISCPRASTGMVWARISILLQLGKNAQRCLDWMATFISVAGRMCQCSRRPPFSRGACVVPLGRGEGSASKLHEALLQRPRYATQQQWASLSAQTPVGETAAAVVSIITAVIAEASQERSDSGVGPACTSDERQQRVVEEYRRRLVDLYQRVNTSNVPKVDGLLEAWVGKEHQLYETVCRKYHVDEMLPLYTGDADSGEGLFGNRFGAFKTLYKAAEELRQGVERSFDEMLMLCIDRDAVRFDNE